MESWEYFLVYNAVHVNDLLKHKKNLCLKKVIEQLKPQIDRYS